MKTRVDLRLLDEAERYALRCDCDDCAHFASDERRCAHGYPELVQLGAAAKPGAELEFCKEFELV